MSEEETPKVQGWPVKSHMTGPLCKNNSSKKKNAHSLMCWCKVKEEKKIQAKRRKEDQDKIKRPTKRCVPMPTHACHARCHWLLLSAVDPDRRINRMNANPNKKRREREGGEREVLGVKRKQVINLALSSSDCHCHQVHGVQHACWCQRSPYRWHSWL